MPGDGVNVFSVNARVSPACDRNEESFSAPIDMFRFPTLKRNRPGFGLVRPDVWDLLLRSYYIASTREKCFWTHYQGA